MLGIQKQKIQPQLLGAHCSVWRQSNKQAITPWCDKCYHSGKQGMPWDCRGDTGGTSEPFSPGGGGDRSMGRTFQAEGAACTSTSRTHGLFLEVKRKNVNMRYES